MLLPTPPDFDQVGRQTAPALAKPNHLTVDAKSLRHDTGSNVWIADGNATGIYGNDVVHADHIEDHQDPNERYYVATGHVSFIDPDGTINADELRYCYKPGGEIGTGVNIKAQIANVVLLAKTMDIRPTQWTFTDYYITNDTSKTPLLSITGAKLVIYPGREADLTSSKLDFLGSHVIGYKEHIFTLDPRTSGLNAPTPELRGSQGLGYNWSNLALIAPNTDLALHSDASPGSLPGYGAQITRSFIPEDKSPYPISPQNSFDQRFSEGYLENVFVTKPSDEVTSYSRLRRSVSAITTFNAGVSGRGYSGEVFTTPISLNYEIGSKLGFGGYLADLRMSYIDKYRENYKTRAEIDSSYEFPPVKLGPNLFNMARLDGAFFQSQNSFGWGRGTESLIWKPVKALTFGGGVFGAVQGGTPDYDIDPLYYRNGFALRGDYILGPRTFSYLARYDTKLGWFDQEFKFTQVVGSLKAFVIFRQYPGDTHYGVTYNLDEFFDLLRRRNPKASSAVNSVGLP